MIKVSVVLSIHNRSKLWNRAADSYLWQTMPKDEFEVLLVDDMSTENLAPTYEHLRGEVNLRHIRVDHRRHPVWTARNPHWRHGQPEDWYHTPAITINLGCHLARGSVVGICHPEILHAPGNLQNAYDIVTRHRLFAFGLTYIGTNEHNEFLDRNRNWTNLGWDGFIDALGGPGKVPKFGSNELYWYTSFLPKEAVEKVGGVDFEYLNGVAGEDDDFRDRVVRAGYLANQIPDIQGFHQRHDHETEPHHRRDTTRWAEALEVNRALYQKRSKTGAYPQPANKGLDWTGMECYLGESEWNI